MQSIHFYKYQAAGNDFVLVDNRQGKLTFSNEEIDRLCDRRFGMGADGLIRIENEPGYDFRMIYHNRDGSQSFCGNGCRAIVHLAHQLGIIGQQARFMAHDGPHTATIISPGIIRISLAKVSAPVAKGENEFYIHTGTDHHVKFVSGLDTYPVFEEGRKIRYGDLYKPGGANVNFVEVQPDGTVVFRIYERGVEDETYSSGSGATACALVASTQYNLPSPIRLTARGGKLEVGFSRNTDGSFSDVWFQGPVSLVYETTLSGTF